jgi:hypothetical protein
MQEDHRNIPKGEGARASIRSKSEDRNAKVWIDYYGEVRGQGGAEACESRRIPRQKDYDCRRRKWDPFHR